MDKRVHEEVDDAADFADRSPEPGLDQLYQHVYANEDVRGRLFFDGRERDRER
jgi:TPP-dependent pyruvate/acetoin dehydrogenase alpha subunit